MAGLPFDQDGRDEEHDLTTSERSSDECVHESDEGSCDEEDGIAAVSVLSFTTVGFIGLTPSAGASSVVSGQITCVANPPQGAWLTANSSGWVNWSRYSGTNTIAYSEVLPNGGSWYLAVGCGGSTARWGVTAYSNTYPGGGGYNFTCYDVRHAGDAYPRCQLT